MTIVFHKDNLTEMQACAAYVAQLTKEDVTFTITDKEQDGRVEVTLTGGY